MDSSRITFYPIVLSFDPLIVVINITGLQSQQATQDTRHEKLLHQAMIHRSSVAQRNYTRFADRRCHNWHRVFLSSRRQPSPHARYQSKSSIPRSLRVVSTERV